MFKNILLGLMAFKNDKFNSIYSLNLTKDKSFDMERIEKEKKKNRKRKNK